MEEESKDSCDSGVLEQERRGGMESTEVIKLTERVKHDQFLLDLQAVVRAYKHIRREVSGGGGSW